MSSSSIKNIYVYGPQGSAGTIGPTGPTGPKGPTGLPGLTGIRGSYLVNAIATGDNIIFYLNDGTEYEIEGKFKGATTFAPLAFARNGLSTGAPLFSLAAGGTFFFRGLSAIGSLYLTYAGENNEYISINSIYAGITYFGNYDPLDVQNYSLLYLKQNNLAGGTPIRIPISEIGSYDQQGTIDLSRSSKQEGASADFGYNLNSASNIRFYPPVVLKRDSYTVKIKDGGTHFFTTPCGISAFSITGANFITPPSVVFGITYSKNEIISTTLVFTSNEVWEFPQNVYFEQGENYLSCGLNVIGMMSYDGGNNWLATVSKRGHGIRDPKNQCKEPYSVGSCCYENADGTLECEDYATREWCDTLSGVYNDLKSCADSCKNTFGICCANGKCIENTPIAECDLFSGIFYPGLTCGTYPNVSNGPNYGNPIELGRLCYDSCLPDSAVVCCKDNKCLGNYSRIQCEQMLGGKSVLGTCETVNCCEYTVDVGSCCVCNPDGSSQCFDALTKAECDLFLGVFMGPGQRCEDVSCGCVCGIDIVSPPPPPIDGYNCVQDICIPVFQGSGTPQFDSLFGCTSFGCLSEILGYNCNRTTGVCYPVYQGDIVEGDVEFGTLQECQISCAPNFGYNCVNNQCEPVFSGPFTYGSLAECLTSGCSGSSGNTYFLCNGNTCDPIRATIQPPGSSETIEECRASGCGNVSWFVCLNANCTQQTGQSPPANSFATIQECLASNCEGDQGTSPGICCKDGTCLTTATNKATCIEGCGNWLESIKVNGITYQFGSNENDCEFCAKNRMFYTVLDKNSCNPKVELKKIRNDKYSDCCAWDTTNIVSNDLCTDIYFNKKLNLTYPNTTMSIRDIVLDLMTCPLSTNAKETVDAAIESIAPILRSSPYNVSMGSECTTFPNCCNCSVGTWDCRSDVAGLQNIQYDSKTCSYSFCPPEFPVGGQTNGGTCVPATPSDSQCLISYCDLQQDIYCPAQNIACAEPHPGICCKYHDVAASGKDIDDILFENGLIGRATCLAELQTQTACEAAGGAWWDKVKLYFPKDIDRLVDGDAANDGTIEHVYQFQSPGDCDFCKRVRMVQKFTYPIYPDFGGLSDQNLQPKEYSSITSPNYSGVLGNPRLKVTDLLCINPFTGNQQACNDLYRFTMPLCGIYGTNYLAAHMSAYNGAYENSVLNSSLSNVHQTWKNPTSIVPVSMGIRAGKQTYRKVKFPDFSNTEFNPDTVNCSTPINIYAADNVLADKDYNLEPSSGRRWEVPTGIIIHDALYYEDGITFLDGGIGVGRQAGHEWARQVGCELDDVSSTITNDTSAYIDFLKKPNFFHLQPGYHDSSFLPQCQLNTNWWINKPSSQCQDCLRYFVDAFLAPYEGLAPSGKSQSVQFANWIRTANDRQMPLHNNLLVNTFTTKLKIYLYAKADELVNVWPNNNARFLETHTIYDPLTSDPRLIEFTGFSWVDCQSYCVTETQPDQTCVISYIGNCFNGPTQIGAAHPRATFMWLAHLMGMYRASAAALLGADAPAAGGECTCCPAGPGPCTTEGGGGLPDVNSDSALYYGYVNAIQRSNGAVEAIFNNLVYDDVGLRIGGAPGCYTTNPLTGREFNSPIQNIKAYINNTEYMCVPVICFDDCDQFEICE